MLQKGFLLVQHRCRWEHLLWGAFLNTDKQKQWTGKCDVEASQSAQRPCLINPSTMSTLALFAKEVLRYLVGSKRRAHKDYFKKRKVVVIDDQAVVGQLS
jgi:hypothetical protein